MNKLKGIKGDTCLVSKKNKLFIVSTEYSIYIYNLETFEILKKIRAKHVLEMYLDENENRLYYFTTLNNVGVIDLSTLKKIKHIDLSILKFIKSRDNLMIDDIFILDSSNLIVCMGELVASYICILNLDNEKLNIIKLIPRSRDYLSIYPEKYFYYDNYGLYLIHESIEDYYDLDKNGPMMKIEIENEIIPYNRDKKLCVNYSSIKRNKNNYYDSVKIIFVNPEENFLVIESYDDVSKKLYFVNYEDSTEIFLSLKLREQHMNLQIFSIIKNIKKLYIYWKKII